MLYVSVLIITHIEKLSIYILKRVGTIVTYCFNLCIFFPFLTNFNEVEKWTKQNGTAV